MHQPAPEAAGRAPARQEALRILFIDDEPMVLNTMQELLRAGGHLVTGLSSGEDGVRRFRAAQAEGRGYDVVITDLSMPNMDGIQVAREIKQASPRTPVILLSGWGIRWRGEAGVGGPGDLQAPGHERPAGRAAPARRARRVGAGALASAGYPLIMKPWMQAASSPSSFCWPP